MSTKPPTSILIIGCGIASPPLATFLLLDPTLPAPLLPSITILERSPLLRSQGQGVDIRGAGVPIMRLLGLETAIRSATTGEEGVHIVDKYDNVIAEGAADKTGKVQTGTSDIEIMRGVLAEILYRRCREVSERVRKAGGKGVEFLFGEEAESVEQDGEKVNVWFKRSGERRSYDIVVGADGLLSKTRRMVWGEEGEGKRMKKLGIYNAFYSMQSGPTDSLWRRWYRAPGRRGVMLRPSGRADRTSVSLFLATEKDPRLAVVATARPDVKAQKELMTEYFSTMGWEADRIVKELNAADDFYYSSVSQIQMEKWSKGRVVLLGDAGYCASPISGMGTTLAFVGAYNLAGALKNNPTDYTAAFAQYEEKMRPVVEVAQKLPLNGRHMVYVHPETAWGIWVFHLFIRLLMLFKPVMMLLFKWKGPPANKVSFEDYGFERLPDTPV